MLDEECNLFEIGMYFGITIQTLKECEILLENIPPEDMHDNAKYSLSRISTLLDMLDKSEKV